MKNVLLIAGGLFIAYELFLKKKGAPGVTSPAANGLGTATQPTVATALPVSSVPIQSTDSVTTSGTTVDSPSADIGGSMSFERMDFDTINPFAASAV